MGTNLIYNLPKAEILAQLAEETSELAQAALKLRRAIDKENPTPKSQAEATDDLIEEIADVQLCLEVLFYGSDLGDLDDKITLAKATKKERWGKRLEAAKMKSYVVSVGVEGDVFETVLLTAISPESAKSMAKKLYSNKYPSIPENQILTDIEGF